MLALHVLSAFAWVAGLIVFWILIAAVRRVDTADETIRMQPIVRIGNAVVGIGMGGTIVLGIVLALTLSGYEIWDGWIVAAIVLWAISAPLGQRTGAPTRKARRRRASSTRPGRPARTPSCLRSTEPRGGSSSSFSGRSWCCSSSST